MKTFKIVGVLFFIFSLSVMPVSAFEDDFNDKEIISDWNIITGTWSVLNTSSILGADDYYAYNNNGATGTTNEMYRSVSGDYSYYEIDMKAYASLNLGGASKESFVFSSNGIINHSINLQVNYPTGAGTYAMITGDGFTYSTVDLTSPSAAGFLTTNWYHIEITTTSNNIKVEVFDINNNLIDSQTNAYSPLNDNDRIILKNHYSLAGNAKGYFDNILLSSVSLSTVNGIEWDLDQYVEGETASYSWNLQNSFWQDLIYKYRIQILKDGTEINTVKVSQTGTRYQEVDTAGTYEVNLQYSGLWPTSWQTVDSDSVNVIPEVDSYINIPQTAYTAESFAISYLYGRTPLGPFLKISKQIPSETGDYTYVNVDADYLKDQNIVAGTVYTPNLTIFESGTYLIGIYDINLLTESRSMLIASDTIRIFYQDAISRINITESKIDTSNATTIGLGDTLFGNYQVDSLNYTTGPIRLEMYNYENDVISFSMPKQAQKGSYELPIKNLEYFAEVKDGHETVYKVDGLFYTGNNQVRLARYDPDGTYNQTLAYTNITIDYVNSAGYSLTLSKYMVVQNEPFTISVKCPTTSRLVIFDDTGYAISNINLSGNVNIPYSLSSKGKYSIQLYDPSTNLQCIELITVNEGVRPDVVVEEEPTQSTIDMVITFLSMPAFWGMIIWVGVVGGVAQSNAVNQSSTGYIAFALGNILAVVGMFAPYTMYILLVLWIGAGIYFKLGNKMSGVEEY